MSGRKSSVRQLGSAQCTSGTTVLAMTVRKEAEPRSAILYTRGSVVR